MLNTNKNSIPSVYETGETYSSAQVRVHTSIHGDALSRRSLLETIELFPD